MLDHNFIIYDNDEIHFKNFGLNVITDAYNIEIKNVRNGEHSLIFNIGKKSLSSEYLKVGRFVKAYGDIFIIRKLEEFSRAPLIEIEVFCEHIMFELIDKFIPYVSHRNENPNHILNNLLSGTRFKGVADITDVVDGDEETYNYQLTRGNALKGVVQLADRMGATVFVDDKPDREGFFTLYLRRDSTNRGLLVHNRSNLSSLKRIIDGSELVTRLYVYGEDGLSIKGASESNGLPYIDSPHINDYPKPIEADITFDSIDSPRKLYRAGLEHLNKYDTPMVSYEIEMENLRKMLNTNDEIIMGDEITVVDEALNLRVTMTVVEINWLPEQNTLDVTLGNAVKTTEEIVSKVVDAQTSEQVDESGVRKGNVWTEWLTVPFTNESITVHLNLDYKTIPVVNVEVYNASSDTSVLVDIISDIIDGETVYNAINITCPSGTGSEIAIHTIGRV